MEDLSLLEKFLKVNFKDIRLLKEALVHRSYLNEYPKCPFEHNERLEFLGDSVLELLVSEYLYKNFRKPEGEMTDLRASLVNSENLANIARKLKIGKFLLLSKGEAKDIGRARIAILANTLEAIIGAIYLDQGLERVREFIRENILSLLPEILEKKVIKDPKTQLQEIAQERFSITPHYEVLEEWGPDHKREFLVGAYLEKKLIAKDQGFSKQEAEEKAAQKALQIITNHQKSLKGKSL